MPAAQRARLMADSMRKDQTRLAQVFGFTSYSSQLPPGVEQLATVMKNRAHFGFLQPCEHIDSKSPEHAIWFAAEPEILRCKTCSTYDLFDRYRQPDRLLCDQCDQPHNSIQVSVSLHGCIYLISALCPTCLEGTR